MCNLYTRKAFEITTGDQVDDKSSTSSVNGKSQCMFQLMPSQEVEKMQSADFFSMWDLVSRV